MDNKQNTFFSIFKQPRGRRAAVVGIAVLLFGAGYLAGGWRSGTDSVPDASAFGDMPDAQGSNLAGLAELLPKLEAKVKASPNDASQRSLLAQTYAELGDHEKSITQWRVLRKQQPQEAEPMIMLAMSLLMRAAPADLKESSALLEEVARKKPGALPMVRLYQGEIRLKQGDAPGAVKIWKGYLAQMAPTDPRRGMFEERIAQARRP